MWRSLCKKSPKIYRWTGLIVVTIGLLCSTDFARATDENVTMVHVFDSFTPSDATYAVCIKTLKPHFTTGGSLSVAAIKAYDRIGCKPSRSALNAPGAPAQQLPLGKVQPPPSVPPPSNSFLDPNSSFLNPNIRTVFVSRDSLNTLGEFGADTTIGKVLASPLGATISATFDQLKDTQQVSGQGYVGFCGICGAHVSGDATFSIGPAFIYDGSLNLPLKAPVSESAFRMGPDLAFDVRNVPIAYGGFYVDALPFFQTDFRGEAQMYGLQLLAEFFDTKVNLRVPGDLPLGFVWRVIPETDVVGVSNPGLTNFVKGTYEFVGGNVQTTFIPFEGTASTSSEAFLNRFSLVLTYKYLIDAADTKNSVSNFQAELDYKIGTDPSPLSGGPSISLAYVNGTDELTLLNQQQIKIQFAYKY
jgi:hypothetical protein